MKAFPDESMLREYYAKVAEDPKHDSLKNPKNPKELMMEVFFVPFLVSAIKDLKCDFI